MLRRGGAGKKEFGLQSRKICGAGFLPGVPSRLGRKFDSFAERGEEEMNIQNFCLMNGVGRDTEFLAK